MTDRPSAPTSPELPRRVFLTQMLAFAGLGTAWGRSTPPDATPALLLAKTASTGLDPAPYWVSEKLDGVRALWDGHRLRFRSGHLVPAPDWFTDALPKRPLDGELWMGRGTFDRLSGIVRSQPPDDADWRRLRYMIFELPDAPGPFSERVQGMRDIVARANVPWLRTVEQFRVRDRAELQRNLDRVVRAGGEGLMPHLASAPYVTGRQDVLLKLKPWQDAEATVIGYVPGKGKYRGMTGALLMQMPGGKRFRIGSGLTDALRRNPPPIGSSVTYRYQALTPDGVPRFARYLRLRDGF